MMKSTAKELSRRSFRAIDRRTSKSFFLSTCHRMSPTLKSTGAGHIGEEGVDRCKPNFNTIYVRHGAVVCKRNRVGIFCRLSTMYERDRQTNHGAVTSIAVDEIACQRCRLMI